ncbi:MAG: isoprenylcysteine carboxylmethyltransferase family protein [Anaerolineales bacterium]|jgi:protein-S-isoprenylcysteine O-methyltransferase Ste14
MKLLRSFGFFLNTLLIFLGLPLLGWGIGDLPGFFTLPQRLGYAMVVFLMGVAMAYQSFTKKEVAGSSRGEKGKFVKRQSVVRFSAILMLFFALLFLPYADRRAICVMDDLYLVRWVGLLCFALGCALVVWTTIALGRLYSAEVTLQKNHQLVTSGPYTHIRHPRYSGGILYVLGFSLLFHSWIGVIGVVLSIAVFLWRIRDEEALMHAEFGREWEKYCQHTWRLIPFIF